MALPGNETCSGCIFWAVVPAVSNGTSSVGQCRRYAPQVLELNGKAATRWPLVVGDWWCGDHAYIDENTS